MQPSRKTQSAFLLNSEWPAIFAGNWNTRVIRLGRIANDVTERTKVYPARHHTLTPIDL